MRLLDGAIKAVILHALNSVGRIGGCAIGIAYALLPVAGVIHGISKRLAIGIAHQRASGFSSVAVVGNHVVPATCAARGGSSIGDAAINISLRGRSVGTQSPAARAVDQLAVIGVRLAIERIQVMMEYGCEIYVLVRGEFARIEIIAVNRALTYQLGTLVLTNGSWNNRFLVRAVNSLRAAPFWYIDFVSRSLKAHILLIFVTFVWGATFVQIKFALLDITPLFFNAVRMTLALAVLVIVYWQNLKKLTPAALKAGILAGIFLWAGYEFQTPGLGLTTPAKSAFLTGASVVLVPVFLFLFWRKKVSRWTALGVAAAFIGLFLLTVPASASGGGLGNFRSINLGDLLTLGCAISFGFQIIFLGRATQAHPFEQIAVLQIATAATLMFAMVGFIEQPHVIWSQRVIGAIVITGVFGTALAFTIQAWAQQFMPPTNTALVFALEPVFALVTSYVVLGEHFGLRSALGAAFILGGLLVSEVLGSRTGLAIE